MTQSNSTNWVVVWLSIIAGIVAALQIGKVPAAIPQLQQEFELSLVQVGWLASLFNVIGAAAGILIGGLIDRFDYRRALISSTLLLLIGSLLGAFAPNATVLFLSRVGESFGLVMVAVSAPRLITAYTRLSDRSLALGAWSMYIPTGFAVGLAMASVVLSVIGWRGLWLTNAIILLAYVVAFCMLTPATSPAAGSAGKSPWLSNIRAVMRVPSIWLLAGVFACYTLQWFALTTWMPTFLNQTMHFSHATSALLGAVIVLLNVVGNLSGAWLLHRGIAPWWLIATALVIMMLCAYGIFASDVLPEWKLVQAMVFSASGGLVPAALLSTVTMHAPTPAHIGTANGFVVQGSHIGILAGAPLLAFILSGTGSWEHSWWLMAVMGTIGLVLAMALRSSHSVRS